MSYSAINQSRKSSQWDHSTTLLASSMMLVSISEDAAVENLGYSSRLLSGNDSGSSLIGWGSAATRQSCKMDLCSLGAETSQDAPVSIQRRPTSGASSNEEQNWGFFTSELNQQC